MAFLDAVLAFWVVLFFADFDFLPPFLEGAALEDVAFDDLYFGAEDLALEDFEVFDLALAVVDFEALRSLALVVTFLVTFLRGGMADERGDIAGEKIGS